MEQWFRDAMPKVLPSGYECLGNFGPEGFAYKGRDFRGSFSIIVIWDYYDDKKWVHLSVARPDKLPSWELLKEIKNLFIGRLRQAIQVLPSEKKYVNRHPNCLHLFSCFSDNDPIPDFTRGGDSL